MIRLYKKLSPYLRGEFWIFFWGIVALLLVDFFQILVPRVTKSAVDAISFGTATGPMLLKYGGMILLLAIGIIITRFFWRYLIIGVSRRMERRLRRAFYSHLITLSPGWFADHKIGDLMALATNDLEAVRMTVGFGIMAFVDTLFLLIASLAMMIIINPMLTLYILLPMPILSVIVGILGKILHKRFQEVQESFASLTDRVREIISGIRVVKSHARESTETKRYEYMSLDYVKKNIKMIVIGGMFDPLIGLVVGLSFAIVLLLGGQRVILAGMSMGDFVAFNSYLGLLIWPMIAVGWIINLYQRGKASAERILEVFDQKPDIVDMPDAISLTQVSGQVEFKNLTFRYKPDLEPALENVSFRIEPGEFFGITGKTGCGKTTLISLLPRLFDPPDGTVFIEGYPVEKIKLSSLRKQIGLVSQDSFLFSASVMENIKFGMPDADDESAIRASEIAQFHKDVINFPNGYDSIVGERGITLSGGQKQRLCIARALLLETPIMIMDDALSAVDTETEESILAGLKKVRAGKTTIVVSHRISALQETDRVVVLDRGRVVEIGTPQELLRKGGYYAYLYRMQQIQKELNNA